jgi:ribosomal protein L12E/L44/L45/RPP1/RPP2
LSKAKRLRLLIGAILLALSVSLSGAVMTGCSGAVTEKEKEAEKQEAEEKEKKSEKKQEEEAEEN